MQEKPWASGGIPPFGCRGSGGYADSGVSSRESYWTALFGRLVTF